MKHLTILMAFLAIIANAAIVSFIIWVVIKLLQHFAII